MDDPFGIADADSSLSLTDPWGIEMPKSKRGTGRKKKRRGEQEIHNQERQGRDKGREGQPHCFFSSSPVLAPISVRRSFGPPSGAYPADSNIPIWS